MTKELIKLQSAHCTQHTSEGVKSDWKVEENATNDNLFVFPPNISDELMFQIMNFARKYELDAFNAGIQFQKGKQNEVLQQTINEQLAVIEALGHDNNRLAESIDKHTKGEG